MLMYWSWSTNSQAIKPRSKRVWGGDDAGFEYDVKKWQIIFSLRNNNNNHRWENCLFLSPHKHDHHYNQNTKHLSWSTATTAVNKSMKLLFSRKKIITTFKNLPLKKVNKVFLVKSKCKQNTHAKLQWNNGFETFTNKCLLPQSNYFFPRGIISHKTQKVKSWPPRFFSSSLFT